MIRVSQDQLHRGNIAPVHFVGVAGIGKAIPDWRNVWILSPTVYLRTALPSLSRSTLYSQRMFDGRASVY